MKGIYVYFYPVVKKRVKYISLIMGAILLQSCISTYFMSPQSLHAQLSKVQDTAYAYHHKFYDAVVFAKLFNNGIDTIHVTDKKGDRLKIGIVGYRAEAILMLKTGEQKKLLFKTMFLKDSLLYGQGSVLYVQTHFKFSDVLRVTIKAPEYVGAGER
jgi:hypothetical protein